MRRAEIKGLQNLLTHHDRHRFRMRNGAQLYLNAINTRSNEHAAISFEDSRTKRPSCTVVDISLRQ
jgi:hypothetical protein